MLQPAFISFFPAFAIVHIRAPLDPHTLGILNTTKKEALQMTSRRWLARLTVPMLVGAALVTGGCECWCQSCLMTHTSVNYAAPA